MSGSHHHSSTISSSKMWFATAITFAFCVTEALVGYFSNSLSLMADAGHNFADALALGLTAFAIGLSRKPADDSHTFGHHRVGILAALVNAAGLVIMAAIIFYEAVIRLRHPEAVQSTPMIGMALAAIVLNASIAVWLSKAAKEDLNIRSAYLHMVGDAAASLGVVVAGIIIALTGAYIADPIVSIVFALLVLWSSWGILKESTRILLEGTPLGMDLSAVTQSIRSIAGVQDIHDLHVWTISSGLIAGSCHLLLNEAHSSFADSVRQAVADHLKQAFNIVHCTIQVEHTHCGGHNHAVPESSAKHTHSGHDPHNDPERGQHHKHHGHHH
jgi:cobalt-zinc-cadmium efflux system protein